MSPPRSVHNPARLSAPELAEVDDAELLEYIARAKRDIRLDDGRVAMHILLDRHERRMRARVAVRLPTHLAHHADTVAEWVLERVMRSALKLSLEGEHPGEWVNWWGRAIDRQVISFWRSAQGQALEKESELPSEQEDGEGKRPDTLGEDLDVDALVSRLAFAEVIDDVLSSMDNKTHVGIIRAAFWEDLEAVEVAKRFDTSAQNVDQIKARFRKRLRKECERRGVTDP